MSGSTRTVRGSFVGTTGVARDILGVGFRPARVELFNANDPVTGYWQDTFVDGAVFKAIAAGTQTFPQTNGITPLADGFRLGTDGDLNVNGEVVHYIAFER